jgi:hypothetical protein
VTDESRPEAHDQQPDLSTDETPGESVEPAGEPSATPTFRLADRVPTARVDLSALLGLQALAQQISDQVAEINRTNIAAFGAFDQRWRVQRPVLPELNTWAAGVAEQIRQTARISASMPQYDFGLDLGRIINANATTWLAKVREFAETLHRIIPGNLLDLTDEDLKEVFRINVEDGTSLAWAPRASIVKELLDAADMDARSAVLVDHAAEVADDVHASLAHVALPDHDGLRGLLLEATDALRGGLYGPAQASACIVFDTVVNVRMLKFLAYSGSQSKNDTRRHFRPAPARDWDDLTFTELGLVLAGSGIATAFEYWSTGNGPASFNRNGSVHHADDGAYSPAHAVRALLIAQASLRWLDAAIADAAKDEDAA